MIQLTKVRGENEPEPWIQDCVFQNEPSHNNDKEKGQTKSGAGNHGYVSRVVEGDH